MRVHLFFCLNLCAMAISHRGTVEELAAPTITGPASSILKNDEIDPTSGAARTSDGAIARAATSTSIVDAARFVVSTRQEQPLSQGPMRVNLEQVNTPMAGIAYISLHKRKARAIVNISAIHSTKQ